MLPSMRELIGGSGVGAHLLRRLIAVLCDVCDGKALLHRRLSSIAFDGSRAVQVRTSSSSLAGS